MSFNFEQQAILILNNKLIQKYRPTVKFFLYQCYIWLSLMEKITCNKREFY